MSRPTILVFDDERAIRELVGMALEPQGFDVQAFEDGPDGVAWFSEHADRVAGVVLDRMLPTTTGEQVLAQLRAIRPDVPILMTSGYSGPTDEQAMRDIGATSFLGKPFRLKALLEAVNTLVGADG